MEENTGVRMKNLRTFAIVDYLKTKKYCSVGELMEQFHVSPATIHRDIASLVGKNLIQKVHGGVAYIDQTEAADRMTVLSSTFQERINWNQNRKQKISETAVQEIAEGDIIFLDSSTTVFFLAERLLESSFSNLTIVTNSAMIIQNFHKFPPHYVLISLGGTFDLQLNAFLGQAAIRELERLSISKAFISAFGIDGELVTTNHEYHSSLLLKVLEVAKKRYLLADRSKFDRSGLFKLGTRSSFDRIITD